MTKYHINSKHMPGVCKAQTKCPYGDITNDHYDSKEDTMKAIEKQALVETTYEKALQQYDLFGSLTPSTLKELEKAKESIGGTSTFDREYSQKYDTLISIDKESELIDESESVSPITSGSDTSGPVNSSSNQTSDSILNSSNNVTNLSEKYSKLAHSNQISDYQSGEYRSIEMAIKNRENVNGGYLTSKDLKELETLMDSYIEDSKTVAISYTGTRQSVDAAYNLEQSIKIYNDAKSDFSKQLSNLEKSKTPKPISGPMDYPSNDSKQVNESLPKSNRIAGPYSNIPSVKSNAAKDSSVQNNFKKKPVDGKSNPLANGENKAESNVGELMSKLGADGDLDKLREVHDIVNSEKINARIALRELTSDASDKEKTYAKGLYDGYVRQEKIIGDMVVTGEKKVAAGVSNSAINGDTVTRLNGSLYKPSDLRNPEAYHSNPKLAGMFVSTYRGENGYTAPQKYITSNAGTMNPATMKAKPGSVAESIIGDAVSKRDSSFVVLSEADGSRPRVVIGAGEEVKDLRKMMGAPIIQEKHGAGIGVTRGLHVVGYISQDGEKFGYIPKKSVPFFAFD